MLFEYGRSAALSFSRFFSPRGTPAPSRCWLAVSDPLVFTRLSSAKQRIIIRVSWWVAARGLCTSQTKLAATTPRDRRLCASLSEIICCPAPRWMFGCSGCSGLLSRHRRFTAVYEPPRFIPHSSCCIFREYFYKSPTVLPPSSLPLHPLVTSRPTGSSYGLDY